MSSLREKINILGEGREREGERKKKEKEEKNWILSFLFYFSII
jgi:hypothetical protein